MARFDKKTLNVGDKVYVAGVSYGDGKENKRYETISKIGKDYFYTQETENGWQKIRYNWNGQQLGRWACNEIILLGPEAYVSEESYLEEKRRFEYAHKVHLLYHTLIDEIKLPMEALQELENFINKWKTVKGC